MHLRGILFLTLVLGLLWAAKSWSDGQAREERARQTASEVQRDLLFGVEPEDFELLRRVRIDNLERSVQVTLEVSSAGTWFMTDPVAWPAEVSVLALLFETLQRDRGQVSTGVLREDVGLDPPRAVCELRFRDEAGVLTEHRLEIGAPDLDPTRLFVAVTDPEGVERILRVNRSLESLFQRFVPDYRSKSILRLEPTSVVEIRRRGPRSLPSPDDPLGGIGPRSGDVPNPLLPAGPFPSLDLAVRQAEYGWLAAEPFAGALDPQAVGMLVLTLARLDAKGFHAETAPDPALFGLDQPELELELVTADRTVHRLRFARSLAERRAALASGAPPDASDWLCQVDDRPTVFEVESRVVLLASAPADAFSDARVVRGALDVADSLTYAAAGREIRLAQEAGAWTVSGPSRDGARLEGWPADHERVEEFLQALRAIELGELLPGTALAHTLVPEYVLLELAGEARGGSFGPLAGPPAEAEEGPSYGFRRHGEELVAAVDAAVLELLSTPPEEFLDRRLLEVEELRMARVEVTFGPRTLAFERDPRRGRWSLAGSQEEARRFAPLVDRLRSLRALSFVLVPEGEPLPDLAEPMAVVLDLPAEPGPRGRPAERIEYQLGVGDGVDLIQLGERRARLYPGLRRDLEGLFAGLGGD